jgi:hypothetical protein
MNGPAFPFHRRFRERRQRGAMSTIAVRLLETGWTASLPNSAVVPVRLDEKPGVTSPRFSVSSRPSQVWLVLLTIPGADPVHRHCFVTDPLALI